MTTELLIAIVVIMSASLSGVLFLNKKLHKWLQHNLRFLITFSMGVFIVITYQLIEESLHQSTSIVEFILWIIIGLGAVEVVSQLLPNTHHHHDTLEYNHKHSDLDARRMLIGDAFHNIGDGILLATAF